MTKKIVLVLGALLFVFLLIMGGRYYQGRYVASGEFYVKVPQNQSTELDKLYDMDGKEVDIGKEYQFEAWDVNGKKRHVEFAFMTEDPQKLLQPGDYVKVETSDTIVLKQKVIEKSDVPTSVLKYIDQE